MTECIDAKFQLEPFTKTLLKEHPKLKPVSYDNYINALDSILADMLESSSNDKKLARRIKAIQNALKVIARVTLLIILAPWIPLISLTQLP